MTPLPKFRFALLALSLAFAGSAMAGTEMKESKAVVIETPFDKGKLELQIGAGAFSSVDSHHQQAGTVRPKFTDVDGVVRLGIMLNTPEGDGFFRGNFEFLLEGYGAGIVEGPGNAWGGLGLMLRYNFVQPGAFVVPYFHIQAGGVYNDVYRDGLQRVFGEALEFDLGAGTGLRFMFSDHFALFLEFDYRHISNADTASRNLGLNSLGGFGGASIFF